MGHAGALSPGHWSGTECTAAQYVPGNKHGQETQAALPACGTRGHSLGAGLVRQHRAMIWRAPSRWLTWCRCLLLQRHAAAGTEHSTEVRPFVELFQIKLGEKSNETPKRPCGRRSATYNSLGRRRNILYLPCNKNPLLGAVARFLKTLSLYVSKTYRFKSSL